MLVKELQSLALDVRVQDKDGNDIDLSELINEDSSYPPSNKADAAAISEALGQHMEEDDEFRKSFQIDGEVELPGDEDSDEELDYPEDVEDEDDDAYGSEFYDDDANE